MGKTDYDRQREANIARNRALLASLGIEKSVGVIVEKHRATKPVVVPSKKRKVRDEDAYDQAGNDDEEDADEEDEKELDQPKQKSRRKASGDTSPARSASGDGPRRSTRNSGKVVDYKSEKKDVSRVSASVRTGNKKEGESNEGPMGRNAGSRRIHNPKQFGHIPGVAVGTWWDTREACSDDAIHAPWVGGIAGSKDTGAYSIALSGGYEDDVDLGYCFTYTGSGGRNLKGTKTNPKNLRTAPQSSDQSFEDSRNASLMKSFKSGKPVRVVRGFKGKSGFAPAEGYRYDGLYKVEKAELVPGLSGFLVCKFAFKRLDGQPALVCRDLGGGAAEGGKKDAKKESSDAGVEDEKADDGENGGEADEVGEGEADDEDDAEVNQDA